MRYSRRVTKTELQQAYPKYTIMEGVNKFFFYPEDEHVQGPDILVVSRDVPTDRSGRLVDLTSTQLADYNVLERIYGIEFRGDWALVRFGEMQWFGPGRKAFKLMSPTLAPQVQLQILWREYQGRPDMPQLISDYYPWMRQFQRYENPTDKSLGSDFYLLDLVGLPEEKQNSVAIFRWRLMADWEQRFDR